MLGAEALADLPRAGALVGAVFAEAMVLYVGYGALIGHVGETVRDALEEW